LVTDALEHPSIRAMSALLEACPRSSMAWKRWVR